MRILYDCWISWHLELTQERNQVEEYNGRSSEEDLDSIHSLYINVSVKMRINEVHI